MWWLFGFPLVVEGEPPPAVRAVQAPQQMGTAPELEVGGVVLLGGKRQPQDTRGVSVVAFGGVL